MQHLSRKAQRNEAVSLPRIRNRRSSLRVINNHTPSYKRINEQSKPPGFTSAKANFKTMKALDTASNPPCGHYVLRQSLWMEKDPEMRLRELENRFNNATKATRERLEKLEQAVCFLADGAPERTRRNLEALGFHPLPGFKPGRK